MSRDNQSEWPRANPNGAGRGSPDACYLTPDGYLKSSRSTTGPLRMGTAPGTGPTGRAVISDYTTTSDYGMDMIARDRRIDRKFPSDLIAREVRGPGPSERTPSRGDESKRKPG